MEVFGRVKTLIGEQAFSALKNASVAVFGIGGVGGYAVEALARCGVGYQLFYRLLFLARRHKQLFSLAENKFFMRLIINVLRMVSRKNSGSFNLSVCC